MANYPSHTTEGECIFCKIVSGELDTPGIFREDDHFMAFLSIFPSTEGNTVVIPKKHYSSDVLALPDDILQKFIIAAKKVSGILLQYFNDVGRVGVIIEGTGINHAHIKLIPMHGTTHMKRGEWKQYLSNEEVYFTKYQGYISSADGPKTDEKALKKLAKSLKN